MNSREWLSDHFWCELCNKIVPWDHLLGNRIEGIEILGRKFKAGKCHTCGRVYVWPEWEAKRD